MINLKNTRRRRRAVELICELLEVDDKKLDAFIQKNKPSPKKADEEVFFNVKDTVVKIESCDSIEALGEFASDERKTVITAYEKRAEELKEGE